MGTDQRPHGAPSQARHDGFTEWYERWIGDKPPLIADHADVLLPDVAGERVLDVACGQGRMSRHLATAGAVVTGIDISAAMLGKTRAAGPPGITYVHADVARHPGWWDGRPFDGSTCELSLMDIDDLAGALSTVAAVLRPGGWFAASIVHPCIPGSERGLSSWPPGQGYDCEGWWISPDHSPEGIRIRVSATPFMSARAPAIPAACNVSAACQHVVTALLPTTVTPGHSSAEAQGAISPLCLCQPPRLRDWARVQNT